MSVNYEELGDPTQKTIIFVHGAGGSSATWFMQLRNLSSDHHVVAIELNGHGKSPDRAEDDVLLLVTAWAAHLHNFMHLITQRISEE
jgi:pimeloyl-ACP methyl ester carboxylesterase